MDYTANLRIFCEVHKSEKNFKVIDAENTAVTDTAALAGGKQLDVAPPSVKGISKRYDIAEFKNGTVDFQTELSIWSPELNIVRTVDMCIM